MICRICNSEKFAVIFESANCPKSSHKFSKTNLSEDKITNISVLKCFKCNAVQLSEDFTEEYADDYQRNTSFSPAALKYIDENIALFESFFEDLKNKKLIEIGCGDGMFSQLLVKKGAVVTGFEPSKAAAKLANERGVAVVNEYFDEKTSKNFSECDGFVLRFVLEHIPRPTDFLRMVGSVCKEGAFGLIELPNFEKMLREKRYFEFFREHVVYFSGNTLARTLNESGFELVHYHTSMNDEYLVAVAKKVTLDTEVKGFVKNYDLINSALTKMVGEAVKNNRKLAFWAASGGGVSLLNYAGIKKEDVECIFDSDPNKQGLYTFGVPIEIRKADKKALAHIGAIIILTPTYEDEILNELRQTYDFEGWVGSIKGVPHWLEKS